MIAKFVYVAVAAFFAVASAEQVEQAETEFQDQDGLDQERIIMPGNDFNCTDIELPPGQSLTQYLTTYTGTVNFGTWYQVDFGPYGRALQTFDFATNHPTRVEFTSIGFPGPRFTLFDKCHCIAKTTTPALYTRAIIGLNPDVTFNSALWSQATACLGPKCHSVTARLDCPFYAQTPHVIGAIRFVIDWSKDCRGLDNECSECDFEPWEGCCGNKCHRKKRGCCGISDGHDQGHNRGYDQGHNRGYDQGQSHGGHHGGYDGGSQGGYDGGHNGGYDAGYDGGYRRGRYGEIAVLGGAGPAVAVAAADAAPMGQ